MGLTPTGGCLRHASRYNFWWWQGAGYQDLDLAKERRLEAGAVVVRATPAVIPTFTG